MDKPLVSVYVTNYNYDQYIEQSIDSVLNQTLQDFELLIIDDGSTDSSKEKIEKYRNHPKVSIIYQQNKGLNVTNNIAMRASSGEYIMRLDADDYLEPDALEVMSKVMEKNPEVGLVFPDYYYVNAEGVRTGEERRHDFEKEVSLYDQPAHGACTMIRLKFLKELGGYNESFTCQDGYDLWIKFIMHHKVTNVNRPLFSYRRHGNNLTTNEERILNTRKKIKELFVDQHLKSLNTLVVIPVRNTQIRGVSWPLFDVGGKSVLQKKVEDCLQARRVSHVIIATSDYEILEHCTKWIDQYNRVTLVERPQEFARPNETLARTIQLAIDHYNSSTKQTPEAVMTVSLEYPFVTSDVMDDAVNTLVLFKADTILSVRPDNRMYYQHTGHTLQPILDQEKFTKLEREALYKGAGGIVLSTLDSFKRNQKMVAGTISHIVVDQKTATGVFSYLDLTLYQYILQLNPNQQ